MSGQSLPCPVSVPGPKVIPSFGDRYEFCSPKRKRGRTRFTARRTRCLQQRSPSLTLRVSMVPIALRLVFKDLFCDYCDSPRLEWRKCKLICLDCCHINKSCADL